MIHFPVRPADTTLHAATVLPNKKTLSVATQSFAKQQPQAFAETLSKVRSEPKNAGSVVKPPSSQNTIVRQNSVTANITSLVTPIGFNALVPATATGATATPDVAPEAATTALSPNDAYWAKQPAAVQQLRKIDDSGQRAMMAAQLAAEGYAIDTPVMVWGWDAGKTMQLRQGFGYTWVPSAMQSPVTAAPGITGAAITPYDPAHPPAGSILV